MNPTRVAVKVKLSGRGGVWWCPACKASNVARLSAVHDFAVAHARRCTALKLVAKLGWPQPDLEPTELRWPELDLEPRRPPVRQPRAQWVPGEFCGTTTGLARHRTLREPACDPCKVVQRTIRRDLRAANRVAS